jgi:hypothetical protein
VASEDRHAGTETVMGFLKQAGCCGDIAGIGARFQLSVKL